MGPMLRRIIDKSVQRTFLQVSVIVVVEIFYGLCDTECSRCAPKFDTCEGPYIPGLIKSSCVQRSCNSSHEVTRATKDVI